MRKSFDGLFGIIKSDLNLDVRDGGLFMFLNQRLNRLKILYWDTDGVAIWMKRHGPYRAGTVPGFLPRRTPNTPTAHRYEYSLIAIPDIRLAPLRPRGFGRGRKGRGG